MSDTTTHLFEGRVVTLLAGIRADGATLIAFPSPCSGVSVASDESGLQAKKIWFAVVRFTVAGAAQVKSDDHE